MGETEKALVIEGIDGNKGKIDETEAKTVEQRQKDAEEVFEERKEKLGLNHPDTVNAVIDLTTIYYDNNQHQKSFDTLTEIIDLQKIHFGEDHLSTSKTTDYLAQLYYASQRYDEALKLFQERVLVEEKVLSSITDEKLRAEREQSYYEIKNNIASIYINQGNYTEAIQCLTNLYDELSKLNLYPIISLQTMELLAMSYEGNNQDIETEDFSSKVFTISSELFGFCNHPIQLSSFQRLIKLYEKQRRYVEAENIARFLLTNTQKVNLDENTSSYCTVSFTMAKDLMDGGKYAQAEDYVQRALEGRTQIFGRNHEISLLTMDTMVVVRMNLGKFEEALNLARECFSLCEEHLGKDHEVTLISLSNLYVALSLNSKDEEALTYGLDCLGRKIRLLGEFSVETIPDRSKVALIYSKQGNSTEIQKIFTPLINHLKEQDGEDNPKPNPVIEELEEEQEYLLAKALTTSMQKMVINVPNKEVDSSISSLSDTTLNPILAAELMLNRKSMSMRKYSLEIEDKDSVESKSNKSIEIEPQKETNPEEDLYKNLGRDDGGGCCCSGCVCC